MQLNCFLSIILIKKRNHFPRNSSVLNNRNKLSNSFLFNPCAFTASLTKIEEFRTAYFTYFV